MCFWCSGRHQHLSHLQMIFVYAAAPCRQPQLPLPNPVSTKQVYQHVPEDAGRRCAASSIRGPAAGRACMHMKAHYCHNRLKRSQWLWNICGWCQTKRHTHTKHVVILRLFCPLSQKQCKTWSILYWSRLALHILWTLHVYDSEVRGGRSLQVTTTDLNSLCP